MIDFRKVLQDKCMELAQTAVGPGSDPVNYVKTFDKRLHDIEVDETPFLVVNVRTAEKAAPGEIGNGGYDLFMWTVHFYYLAVEVEDWQEGSDRRDIIFGKLEKALEENKNLNNLQSTSTDGKREYVYDSSITAGLFDDSGEEEYYSFVSELYFNVYTARS